ncbi:conserved hypothetical protein [Leishmania braziliensis MHOM/BR/75/M2904]|uniref:Uncharacterized protein n=2 Tax=Leishmania braziliensis TaxID=5660 RepID=A4HC57_LEIBR|nr:conserved hypothetical protein [Leishmania braziliensis MHOM/BR/75/M2904]CAJ2472723.1 unnamed protein product [Leishmania braziliensis]CAM45048.1 conserved hypothetical protein [Leishmania braziliensis MHOM/BR/75/M2904]SYZ65831.1 hypothetical_protein [Leishmania braziliensis MHOM/BR/75/M2904]
MGPPVLTSTAASEEEGGGPTALVPSMEERWSTFQRLTRASEAAFRGMSEAAARQNADIAAHQQEIAAYQESQRALFTQQQQRLDGLTRECTQLRQSEAGMKEVVAHQVERLVVLESELQATRVQLSEARLLHAQCVEERNRLQQACKMHEVHTGELQAALQFAEEVVRSMRHTVGACEQEKNEALMHQYSHFESYRNDLVAAYDQRAMEARDEFTKRVESLHVGMLETVAKREEQLKATWEEAAARLRHEYDELVRLGQQRRAAMDTELRERKEQLERDKELMRAQQREEAGTMEQRFRAREETLLDDISRRERELREREAALRAAQVQQEADVQRRLQSRESELRAAHDAALKRMADQAAAEREKLSENFMERLQQLSNAHMQQERELERMHREKEREMAQRYRLSALDGGDRGEVHDRRATEYGVVGPNMAKEALLKKFESVEQRQRERSDKLRSAFSVQESEPRPPL